MSDSRAATLISITALARSGAVDLAWKLFDQAGLGAVEDDPAVLALRGRLLKDRTLAAQGAERRRAAKAAAECYAASAGLRPAAYPLINAAALSLIAGEAGESARLAAAALDQIETDGGAGDTPYYLGATRAEALLLLGDEEKARDALRAAIALAPEAWEDHASTLRQFAFILAEQGRDAAWLDALRPPRSLHFAGQMRIGEAGEAAAIDSALDAENVGFGYGSLAAGADILLAERLLARDAELHLVLPAPRAQFAAWSVDPFGPEWRARFEAVLGQAASVREVPGIAGDAYPLAIELADEIAMGLAAMHARTLQSEALQVLVGAVRRGLPAGHNSARVSEIWRAGKRRQHLIASGAPPAGGGAAPEAGEGYRLAAIVAVSLAEPLGGTSGEEIAARMARLPGFGAPIAAPGWRSDGVVLAYSTPSEAAAAARAVVHAVGQSGPLRIGAHYAVVSAAADPWRAGAAVLVGMAAGLAEQILSAAPTGAVYASENFAASLAATGGDAAMQFIGDLAQAAVPLYALGWPGST
ncbi:MAG TPA: TRAFs-binding domain-containing protein [Allosphingosinicella sp.]|jgi:hypothetical protein